MHRWHGLPFRRVAGGYAVDHGLRLFVPDLLVVVHDIAQVVAAAVVRFSDGDGVVG